jgi:hypothetical protein
VSKYYPSGLLLLHLQGSIEDIHDAVHDLLGGGSESPWAQGHMSFPPYSSFDPVFWLHHCNVDRQLALWEALHPTVSMNVCCNAASAAALAQMCYANPFKPSAGLS